MSSQLYLAEKVIKQGLTEKEKKEHINSAAEAAKTMRTNLYLDDTYGMDNVYRSIRMRPTSSPKVM